MLGQEDMNGLGGRRCSGSMSHTDQLKSTALNPKGHPSRDPCLTVDNNESRL